MGAADGEAARATGAAGRRVFAGTSGLWYPAWRGSFYPDRGLRRRRSGGLGRAGGGAGAAARTSSVPLTPADGAG